MTGNALDQLLALQHPTGCFPSTIVRNGNRVADWNGFVTATVLRALRHLPDSPALTELRRRGLDFLWSCRSARVPDAFAFWPEASRPPWARGVPPDADDTAMMAAELLRYGRLDRPAVLRGVWRLVESCRLAPGNAEGLPPWVRPGSFVTWIVTEAPPKGPANVVDCCVNTNVVALMSQANVRHLPGYDDAIRTVLAGLQWADADERKLRTLTPFYPALRSLLEAVEHAIECGVEALRPAAAHLRSVGAGRRDGKAGCCNSAYGGTVWHSEAIDIAYAASLN